MKQAAERETSASLSRSCGLFSLSGCKNEIGGLIVGLRQMVPLPAILRPHPKARTLLVSPARYSDRPRSRVEALSAILYEDPFS
jgi:hypothetical protein